MPPSLVKMWQRLHRHLACCVETLKLLTDTSPSAKNTYLALFRPPKYSSWAKDVNPGPNTTAEFLPPLLTTIYKPKFDLRITLPIRYGINRKELKVFQPANFSTRISPMKKLGVFCLGLENGEPEIPP